MAEYVELYMDQGADFSLTVNLTDESTELPENLANTTVTSSIRKSLLSINTTAQLTCTLTDASAGEFTVSMPAANTANVKPGRYFFDVKVNSPSGISRLIEGVLVVTPSITR